MVPLSPISNRPRSASPCTSGWASATSARTRSPLRLLIDTDTASDDAVALLLALRTPGVEVEAITVVAGNVPVEQGVQNALYTVELAGADVPVYAGKGGTKMHGHDVHGD